MNKYYNALYQFLFPCTTAQVIRTMKTIIKCVWNKFTKTFFCFVIEEHESVEISQEQCVYDIDTCLLLIEEDNSVGIS